MQTIMKAALRGLTKKLCPLVRGSLVGLTLCVPQAQALEVRMDMGGSVEGRLQQIRQLEQSQTSVRITGTCVSACTLFLGLSRACVTPQARLGFHGPSTRLAGIPLTRREFDRVTQEMARHYPPAIGAWFLSEARMTTGDYITISGAEAIRMGARACR